jgi:hypothetical protein
MLSRDRIVEMLKIIEVLYIPREHSDYVERLNTFLNPTNNPGITTAM